MAVEENTLIELLAARARGDVDGALIEILGLAAAQDIISFSGGFPDPLTFPGPALGQILAELIAGRETAAFQYAPIGGLPSMLEFLEKRLERLEGLRPAPGELMVTSGGIDGLGLVSKSFLERGDLVAVEGPTYLGALMAFQSFEAEITAVPMDEEDGLNVEAVEQLALRRAPKLLYTIPDFQNPAGVTMSRERRTALVAAARRHGFLLVEDVAYRELGFGGERLPSLWSLAPDVVVQLGTFSKTFCPGIRLGWAVGPADIVAHLVLAKQTADQCAAALGQRLLEEYARRGLLEEQDRRARELYRRRCGLMLEALEMEMPEYVRWTRPEGGFFTWLTLPPHVDTKPLATDAMKERVAYVPGALFFPDDRGDSNLRLSFSNVADELIPDGIHRLGVLFRNAITA